MNKIRVIELLNKIANGEIKEGIMFQYNNGYEEYANVNTLFDRFTINKENLNTEIVITEEDKNIEKIQKIQQRTDTGLFGSMVNDEIKVAETINKQANYLSDIVSTINEIIDKLNEMEKE